MTLPFPRNANKNTDNHFKQRRYFRKKNFFEGFSYFDFLTVVIPFYLKQSYDCFALQLKTFGRTSFFELAPGNEALEPKKAFEKKCLFTFSKYFSFFLRGKIFDFL